MPLAGIIDPSYDERANDEPGRLPRWKPIADVLEEARTAPPMWSPWTYEMVKSAVDAHQERDYISTTMLVGGCARSKVIERYEQYVGTLDETYRPLRGTQVHRTLEGAARPNSVAEVRFFSTFEVPKAGKVEVSCSPDLITTNPTALSDYKVVQELPLYQHPYKAQTKQVNFNRYLVNHAEKWTFENEPCELPWNPRELRFEYLYLVYLGPTAPKILTCLRSQPITYKNGNQGTKQLPYVWDDYEVEDELIPRLTGMVKALAAYPEWPVGLEDYPGFEGPAEWACPGKPLCNLPACTAKRYPNGLMWESE